MPVSQIHKLSRRLANSPPFLQLSTALYICATESWNGLIIYIISFLSEQTFFVGLFIKKNNNKINEGGIKLPFCSYDEHTELNGAPVFSFDKKV